MAVDRKQASELSEDGATRRALLDKRNLYLTNEGLHVEGYVHPFVVTVSVNQL